MLQCLKINVLSYETCISENEISADRKPVLVELSQSTGKLQYCKERIDLRGCVCHSCKLIASHQAPYQVASVTLRGQSRSLTCPHVATTCTLLLTISHAARNHGLRASARWRLIFETNCGTYTVCTLG